MSATITWVSGEVPKIGDYLKAERGRTAYHVVGIRWPSRPGTKHLARLTVDRLQPPQIPNGSTVIIMRWSSR